MSRRGRRQRDIERRQRELDRLDAMYGLGAALPQRRVRMDWRRILVPVATLALVLVIVVAAVDLLAERLAGLGQLGEGVVAGQQVRLGWDQVG